MVHRLVLATLAATALFAGAPSQSHARPQQPPRTGRPLPDRVLFDEPRGDVWATGHTWKAGFDAGGFTFIPYFGSDATRNFPIRIELDAVHVGGEALAVRSGSVRRTEQRITIDRGAVVETIDTTLTHVEQSFVLQTLPNRGAVTFAIRMQSELAASGGGIDGLTFANEFGSVRYHKAVAIDARGASLALPIEWRGDGARITIPADFVAAAELPLVLDPIVQTNNGIAPGETLLQRLPDCATLQSPDRCCVVWQRQWSATDQDCYGDLLDGALNYVLTYVIVLDSTGESWVEPRVASNANSRTFLVVAQSTLGGNTFIVSRLINGQTGATGQVVDVERGGLVGLPGRNFSPDVGGDPFGGTLAYYCVVWAHETTASNKDIHFKLLDQNGQLLSTMPTVLSNLPTDEDRPSISETNRTSEWRLAWQRRGLFPPFDWNIDGGHIGWDGTITVQPYVIVGWTGDQTLPSCSSPIVAVDGSEVHMVAFERAMGGHADIHCVFLNLQGLGIDQLALSQSEAFGLFQSRNQILPECDSDGTSFAVGYSESNGFDYDTLVSTVRWTPFGGARIDETRVSLGQTPGVDDYWTRIAAWHSGGLLPNAQYVIAGGRIATNDIAVWSYGGYQPGAAFAYYPTQCGTLSILPNGSAAIGSNVRFDVITQAPSGTVFGTPGVIPLTSLGCNCYLGVANGIFAGNPLQFTIPGDPGLVGSVFSIQGFGFSGQNCLGLFDLSDTVDMTIR
jgi:hypothetical protein